MGQFIVSGSYELEMTKMEQGEIADKSIKSVVFFMIVRRYERDARANRENLIGPSSIELSLKSYEIKKFFPQQFQKATESTTPFETFRQELCGRRFQAHFRSKQELEYISFWKSPIESNDIDVSDIL